MAQAGAPAARALRASCTMLPGPGAARARRPAGRRLVPQGCRAAAERARRRATPATRTRSRTAPARHGPHALLGRASMQRLPSLMCVCLPACLLPYKPAFFPWQADWAACMYCPGPHLSGQFEELVEPEAEEWTDAGDESADAHTECTDSLQYNHRVEC